jgi:ribosomal protein S18 acetylase RimI-like enzyme
MVAHYNAAKITLHVRKSNRAAISLYRDTLGFEVHLMEKGYCEWFGCSQRLPR